MNVRNYDPPQDAQGTSAGIPTTHLVAPTRARNNAAAALMIIAGVVLLLSNGVRLWDGSLFGMDSGEIGVALLLSTLGSGFLALSFWKRIYGLLIPGCILTGLGFGFTAISLTDGASLMWGLSGGFAAIYLLGSYLFQQRAPWPLFPSIALLAVGALILASNMPAIFGLGLLWIPIAIIALGWWLGMRRVA